MSKTANQDLMQSLVAKLYQVLTGKDDPSASLQDEESFIAWCRPGKPIRSQDLNFITQGFSSNSDDEDESAQETTTLYNQGFKFSSLVNMIPEADGIYNQNGSRLADIYGNVLQFSKVAEAELSDEDKKKLQEVDDFLITTKHIPATSFEAARDETGPSDAVKNYNKYKAAWIKEKTNYRNKRLSAMNKDSARAVQDYAMGESDYLDAVTTAQQIFMTEGKGNLINKMRAFVTQTTQRSMLLKKTQLQANFDKMKLTDPTTNGNFYTTFLAPGDFAENEEGWTEFSFLEENKSSYDRSETNAWSAEGGGSYGLFSASFKTSGSITETESTIDTSNFSMKFKLASIPIVRPWFDPDFVNSPSWKWATEDQGELSNGMTPPKGRMVAYTTEAIFVKDIVINCDEFHKEESGYLQKIHAEAQASYGPFSLSGSYDRDLSEDSMKSKLGKRGLSVPGMQIIGFKCALVKASPNPSDKVSNWQ